jgi:hypothetical protein
MTPALHRGEVHIWRFSTDQTSDALEKNRSVISDEERQRAARFRVEHKQAVVHQPSCGRP